MKKKFYSFLCFLCCIQSSYAQIGQRDPSFGKRGLVKTTLAENVEFYSLAFQPDGKVIAAGYVYNSVNNTNIINFLIARYTADGTPDTSFSEDGIQTTDFGTSSNYAYSAAVQKDGKIVVAGTSGINTSVLSTFAIARYNSDGNLDSSFSGDGKQTIDFGYFGSSAGSVAIQSDGRILIKGTVYTKYNDEDPYFTLARLNNDGSLDSTFSGDGKLIVDSYFTSWGALKLGSVAVQKNGKIITGGSNALYRYNHDGSSDSTFGVNGKVATKSFITDFTLTNNDKIVTAGQIGLFENSAFAVARFNNDGSPDSTFNGNGLQITSLTDYKGIYRTVVSQPDGKIIAGGNLYTTSGNFTAASDIIRYNFNGSVDSTFAEGKGIVSSNYYTVSLSVANNKLYSTGGIEINSGFVARYFIDTNKAPVVRIITPADNQKIAGPSTIHLRADANDPDGAISKVEFYNGSVLLRTETDSPYTYTWENVPVGNYALTAVATDKSGLATASAVVNISVVPNKVPTVSITAPVNTGNFAAPATIRLIASANDPDGTISKVEFYNDSVLIGTQYLSPYASYWRNVPEGTYTITAKAIDNLGLSAMSAPITITVTNTTIVSSRPYSESSKTALKDALGLKLSPNPAANIINISTSKSQQSKPVTITIISVSGIVLKTMRISNTTTQLDVSSFKSGVYTIKIISGDKTSYKQFVKL